MKYHLSYESCLSNSMKDQSCRLCGLLRLFFFHELVVVKGVGLGTVGFQTLCNFTVEEIITSFSLSVHLSIECGHACVLFCHFLIPQRHRHRACLQCFPFTFGSHFSPEKCLSCSACSLSCHLVNLIYKSASRRKVILKLRSVWLFSFFQSPSWL